MGNAVSVTISESHPTQPRNNTVTVRVTASAASATVLPLFTRALPWTLVAEANVQQEMPFDNAIPAGNGDDDDDDD